MRHQHTTSEAQIYQTKEGHAICKLASAIAFNAIVGDQELRAHITHAEEDGEKWSYHVAFADGYKGVFVVDKKRGLFFEKGQATQNTYAKAISTDLRIVYQFDPTSQLPFWLSVAVNGENKSVWVKYERECHLVFYDNELRFFLHPWSGRWVLEPMDLPNTIIHEEIRIAVLNRIGHSVLN